VAGAGLLDDVVEDAADDAAVGEERDPLQD